MRRVRGSILVQTAIALSLLIILLISIELGYMFYLKREMQKAVDLSALAGAQVLDSTGANCARAKTAAVANATLNLPTSVALTEADVVCGRWDPVLNKLPTYFVAAGEPFNAVSIVMTRTPPLLLPAIPGNQPRLVSVQATASRVPRAQLTIRSTLVPIDSTRAPLLNAVLGGMLGSSVSLDVVGYNGMINSNIQLLDYLDELASHFEIAAGRYDDVLATTTKVSTLLQFAVTVLKRQGSTAQAAVTALQSLQAAAVLGEANPDLKPALVRLGDLLGVQAGTPAAALAIDLQVFQLAEGLVQLANGQNGAVATIPVSVPGLINLTAHVRAIEPAQISAVGDPALAKQLPLGANKISVRTAQIRTLITVELPVLKLPLGLPNLCLPLLVCLDPLLLPNARIDIALDIASGESHVTDYDCLAPKWLKAQTKTAIAELRIGRIGQTDSTVPQAVAAAFSSSVPPEVTAVKLLDIGSKKCPLLGPCEARKPYDYGGLELKSTLPSLLSSYEVRTFTNPPDVGHSPDFQAISLQNPLNSVSTTLKNASLIQLIPPSSGGSGISVMEAIVASVRNLIAAVMSSVLAPLLDPLINTLLHDVLGLNLAQVEVGANLSCPLGAQLVY
jgi:uncharacterized membrane protein